ncbi:MAG: hypothetical protein GXP62_16180 [Oligoflexia bacterium]|nr:hypothetical protein [Oligoflexia bacterium]
MIALMGGLDDMLFILYFETFPEHWHGHYQLSGLASRVPEFYWIWLRYTGGGLLLAALCIVGPSNSARRGLRFLLASALIYSLLLCTIDHHPTHYFLPLIALTGPAVVAASTAASSKWMKWVITLFTLAGLWTTLWIGQVF